jgi:ubiquinone/menaquinone biosynthesis C-methylase UbiE
MPGNFIIKAERQERKSSLRPVSSEFQGVKDVGQWFPRMYDSLMEPLERRGIREIRRRLIEKAHGQVLEIGSGTGLNFPFYGDPVSSVQAIEPDPLMLKKSLDKIRLARVPITVIQAGAEDLPFADHSFDTVVGTLVFCTIPHPRQALHEIRRVCKPGGTVLLFEHVRSSHAVWSRLQDWLTPLWKPLCGGCHLNRDTLPLVQESGFAIVAARSHMKDIFWEIEAINHP